MKPGAPCTEWISTESRDNPVIVQACFRQAAESFGRTAFNSPTWQASNEILESKKRFGEKTLGADPVLARGGDDAQDPDPAWDAQRWALVEQALRAPVVALALTNRFLPEEASQRARSLFGLEPHPELSHVFSCAPEMPTDKKAAAYRAVAGLLGGDGPLPRPTAILRAIPEPQAKLLPCVFLAGASAIAAQALRAEPGERVLDLCAGPGAKALLLASALLAPANAGGEPQPGGLLVCNEPDRQRLGVLEGLLSAFVPEALLATGGRVVLTSAEATERAPRELLKHGPFDKVLVDPPCSDARTLLGSAKGRMTAGRIQSDETTSKRNTELMERLLRCAGGLVRPGGLVLYCTTSLEHRENDELVRKALRRMGDEFTYEAGRDDWPVSGAERTSMGTLVLPDQGTDHGPVYTARILRKG